MATNTSHGYVEFEEHFTGIKVIADKPEYGVDTDPAVEILRRGIEEPEILGRASERAQVPGAAVRGKGAQE